MNSDQPSREQIEARITALLLGELPTDEATLLRYTIAQDPGLQKLHDELAATMVLVREVEKKPADGPADNRPPLQLPADRRQKLLAHFKTPRPEAATPEPSIWLRPIGRFSVVPYLVAIALIAVLAAMLLPTLSKAKMRSQRVSAEMGARQRILESQMELANNAPTPAPATVNAPESQPTAPPPAVSGTQIVLPQLAPENAVQAGTPVESVNRPAQAQDAATFAPLSEDGKPPTVAAPPAAGPAMPFANSTPPIQLPASQTKAGPQVTADRVAQTRLGAVETPPGNAGLAESAIPNGGEHKQATASGKQEIFVLKSPSDTSAGQILHPARHSHKQANTQNSGGGGGGGGQPTSAAAVIRIPNGTLEQAAISAPAKGGVTNSWSGKPWGPSAGAIVPNGTYAMNDKNAQLFTVNQTPPTGGEIDRLTKESAPKQDFDQSDLPLRKPAPNAPLPQPEILASSNAFSTFSLNVSDVSFKLAEASLQNGKLPDSAAIRSEEFINAFDYRDPEAAAGQAMAFTSERARYPFAHNRELLRFAIKTAAAGRQQGRALNLVLLLDRSGSMERADRVAIIREALRVLVTQLQPQDTVSVVTFARTARLWADGVSGDKAGDTLARVGGITPEGGTNLEEAMRLAYETARRHYLANGINRVVLLTDGAANLGNVDPDVLKHTVEAQRKQGIVLDCFGIGWEDYNDDLLEQLSSNGDGRYAFLNSPEEASKDFAAKLAGALQIAAADVKVQVEFNPARVTAYRQIGYATHQLTKEQFRDNTVAAGQIAAQEAGNALYTIAVNPRGEGPVATVHVRYRIPGTQDYREHSWDVAYTGTAPALERTSAAMRLAATASAFSEWLAASPYAQEVTLDKLLKYLNGVPEIYGADDRPKQLETMIREAKSLEGK
jgi:Mg-chelatase subunit ChlD/type II secretory pathway pseudopilin PulG